MPAPDEIGSVTRCIRPNKAYSVWWSNVVTADRYEVEEINAITGAQTTKHEVV